MKKNVLVIAVIFSVLLIGVAIFLISNNSPDELPDTTQPYPESENQMEENISPLDEFWEGITFDEAFWEEHYGREPFVLPSRDGSPAPTRYDLMELFYVDLRDIAEEFEITITYRHGLPALHQASRKYFICHFPHSRNSLPALSFRILSTGSMGIPGYVEPREPDFTIVSITAPAFVWIPEFVGMEVETFTEFVPRVGYVFTHEELGLHFEFATLTAEPNILEPNDIVVAFLER